MASGNLRNHQSDSCLVESRPQVDNGRVARVLLDQATRELLNMRMGQELVADSEAYIAALSAADEGDLIPLQRLVLTSMQ